MNATTQHIPVDELLGGEITPAGIVDHITCESDGVDVRFNGNPDDCLHYNYGETLPVSNAAECGHIR